MIEAVRTAFGPDDEDGFFTARQSLVARFERWLVAERLAEQEAPEMAGAAGLVLEWKWRYGDGDLARWRSDDVTQFLLEWCPRKLSISPAGCLAIPAAVAAFVTFFDAEDLLAPESSSVAELTGTVARVADEFVDAMGDMSKFGLAKSLFAGAAGDGVDLADPESAERWLAQFNDRPEEERRRIIPDSALILPPPPQRPQLPPMVMPNDADVAASKAAAPILGMFATFAQFVGDGRKLTQTGKLTLADARVLVDRLGTGDAFDAQIGDRTFKTKTSAELPRLRLVFAWAKKAGVVRVAHGRIIATKRGLAMTHDPASSFDRAVDALLAIGPLSAQRDPEGWFARPEVNAVVDRLTVHLLIGPYVTPRPIPIDDMAAIAVAVVLDAFEFPALGEERAGRSIAVDVIDVVDALELAGMVRRTDVVPPDDELLAGRRRRGGSVEFTAAGMVTARRLLIEAGYDAPAALSVRQ